MCGKKPCRKCAAKMSGIKKRRKMAIRKNNLTGQLTNVALAAVGYIVADQVNKLPFVSNNPQIGNFVKFGAGTYLVMVSRNPMLVSAAQGMALNGAIGAFRQYGIISGIGQLGPGSNWNPGVAGNQLVIR